MRVNGHDHNNERAAPRPVSVADRQLLESTAGNMLPIGKTDWSYYLRHVIDGSQVQVGAGSQITAADAAAVAHAAAVARRDATGATDTDGLIARLADMAYGEVNEEPSPFPSISFAPITEQELARARLTPRKIVSDLLYADVRILNAAGGTGKTTVELYEATIMALGRPLYGRDTGDTRRTVMITREDSREILAARLREIIKELNLSAGDVAHVREMVRIVDASSERFRLSAVVDDVVEPHQANIDWLTAKLEPIRPDRLIFDPLVSFGVGEARVNDAEQGLIEAFRIFRNRLDCCAEGIHHIGKANSREKTLDQYSGRGGSALADGSRMVAVMQPLDADEWQKATGLPLANGETGIVMALPKLSYAKKQEPIFIARHGYHFEMVDPVRRTPEQAADATAEQVLQFIRHEYGQGKRYSQQDLENSRDKMGLSRNEIRAAVSQLKVTGKAFYHHVNGKPGSHFEPIGEAATLGDAPVKTA